jgi:hypothetical protein
VRLFKERIRRGLAPAFPDTLLRPRAIPAAVARTLGWLPNRVFSDRSVWLVANVPSSIEGGIEMFDLQAAKAKYS